MMSDSALVGVHGRAARALQRGEAAEVRAVPVRDHDAFQLGRLAGRARSSCLEDEPSVALEERVDERELVAVVDEERVDAAALLSPRLCSAGRELRQAPPTCRHGAKAFSTPCSAGASSG